MCQIKLVRLLLRLQLKILQLGNAAQQARRTLGAFSSHPRQFAAAPASSPVTNGLKIRQKKALIAAFNISRRHPKSRKESPGCSSDQIKASAILI